MVRIKSCPIQLLLLSAFFGISALSTNGQFPDYPEMKFVVFSDPHFFDPSLGKEGKAFQDYLDKDRKLLRNSKELTEELTSIIEKMDVDFVLVPGDLTKDGEMIDHLAFAEYLKRIESSGKKVFVIPGNHDINNPLSYRYLGETSERVHSASPEEFAEIYAPFGYGSALRRDKNTLSYVAEPREGLWLLCLDACRYKENQEEGHPITEGRFSKETIHWIQEVLQEAKNQNKAVMVMMHHGIIEHYYKQKKLYGEYVVDGYKKVSKILAKQGVRLVFTGHFHAQDITIKYFGKHNFILDTETGSLVTYPSPYRTVSISSSQLLSIKSGFIASLPSQPAYPEYARSYVHAGISRIAANTLIGMKVDSSEAWSLSGQVADAFLAHYAGDEITPEKPFDMEGISLKGRFLIGFKKNLVKSLHHDLYPADNILEMKLK
jgi:3',5'-cyclic AMP phosphodiesterase CpdA